MLESEEIKQIECADAIAKCSVENQSDHDIHKYTDQHKLGPKSEKVPNHQSTKCYTKFQKMIKDGSVKKDKYFILDKCKSHLQGTEK